MKNNNNQKNNNNMKNNKDKKNNYQIDNNMKDKIKCRNHKLDKINQL